MLILVVLLIRKASKGHIKKWLQYGLWIVVAIKLLVFPVPWVTTSFAIISPDSLMSDVFMKNDDATYNGYEKFNYTMNDQSDMNSGGENEMQRVQSDKAIQNAKREKSVISAQMILELAQKAFVAVWILGSVILTVIFVGQNLKLRNTLIKNRRRCKQKMVPLKVYTVKGLSTPCLYGGDIYTSRELLEDPQQRVHVLMHEYCHYLHMDNLWSVIRCICLVVYWWNPLVWIAARCSKTDCELACDEAVLKLIGEEERIEYGRTLISLLPVKSNNYLLVASTMEGGKHSMKDRITFISRRPKTIISLCVIAVLIVGVVLFFSVMSKPGEINVNAEEVAEQELVSTSEAETEEPELQETEIEEADTQDEEGDETVTTDFSDATDLSSEEVVAFGKSVSKMFADKDWNSLSEVIGYPITISDRHFETKEEFAEIDWTEYFSQEFIDSVSNASPAEYFANWSGIAMGGGQIWLNEIDGKLYIGSINYFSDIPAETTPGYIGYWNIDADYTHERMVNYASLHDLFGSGIRVGENLELNEDGSVVMSIGMSVYVEGTYEITDSGIKITGTDGWGENVSFEMPSMEDNGMTYLVYEYDGEKIYWKKLG